MAADSKERGPREALRLAAKCSRAFVSAVFQTTQTGPLCPAAHDSMLGPALAQADVSAAGWSTFCERIAERNGPRMRRRGDLWVLDGLRNREGSYLPFRPGIYWLVQRALRDAHIPAPLLRDWYKDDLCATHRIDDGPDFLAFAQRWLTEFAGQPASPLDRSHLLRLHAERESRGRSWGLGLIEMLEFMGVLDYDPKHPDGYVVRFRVLPAGLLASLFGRSTGTEGLDDLLFGGLWVPARPNHTSDASRVADESLSMVISGAPGLGKSTLALGMGLQAAARGGQCLLFPFELSAASVERQIDSFFRRLKPFARVFRHGDPDPEPDFGQGGELIICETIPTCPERVAEAIADTAASLSSRGSSLSDRVAILDSVSAIEGYGQLPEWRLLLRVIAGQLRQLGFTSVFVLERNSPDSSGFEDFQVDVDVRLSQRKTLRKTEGHRVRAIEVYKTRGQISHRGLHFLTLETDIGVKVYPSTNALLSEGRRREARARYMQSELIDPGVSGFARYLCDSKSEGSSASSESRGNSVSWWRRGGVTALIGPRGCLKHTFGELFARTPEEDPGVAGSALSVHFSDDFPGVPFGPEDLKQGAPGVRYDRPLGEPGEDGMGPTRSYILFRSGYISPGPVMRFLRDLIAEKRALQIPILRAVISDLGNIGPDFPPLKLDSLFVPAICDLLASQGITTLLIYSHPQRGGEDPVLDQVRSVAENLIQVSRVSYAGRHYTSLSIERSVDSSHDRGVYELARGGDGLRSDPARQLEIQPTFDLVLDVPDAPKAAKVKLLLHAETDLQRQYHETVRQLHQGLGAYDVDVLDHAVAFAQHGVARHIMAAERALWVVQADAYRIAAQIAGGSGAEVMCDLMGVREEKEKLEKALGDLVLLPARPHPTLGPVLSLPYYLNPSILVVRQEVLEYAREQSGMSRATRGKVWGRVVSGQGDYSWTELMGSLAEFRRERSDRWGQHALFECPLQPHENLNCVFLELLQALLQKDGNGSIISIEALTEPKTADRWVQAALLLRQFLGKRLSTRYSDHGGHEGADAARRSSDARDRAGGNVSERTDPVVSQKALMWRHWYGTFRQMAADMSGGDCRVNPGLALIRLPGCVWTNGDWHLGILQGSVGVGSGARILREEFVTEPAGLARMAQGVGLPVSRRFYEVQADVQLPVAGVDAGWFQPYISGKGVIYRSQIGGYLDVSPLINSYLAGVLAAPDELVGDRQFQESVRAQFASLPRLLGPPTLPVGA